MRGRGEFLGAVGTDDVEAHQIGSDGATGGAAGAVVEENFGHAGTRGENSGWPRGPPMSSRMLPRVA